MLFKLFRKKNVKKMVISFTTAADGTITSTIAIDKGVNAVLAQGAVTKISANIAFGLKDKVSKDKRFGNGAPGMAKFVNALTIGDIMKTKTFKY